MLTIAIVRQKALLVVDGQVVAAQVEDHRGRFHVTLWRDDLLVLGTNTLADISEVIDRLAVRHKADRWTVRADILNHVGQTWVYTRLTPNHLKWSQPWSVSDFGSAAAAMASRTPWPFQFEMKGKGVHEYHHDVTNRAQPLRSIFDSVLHDIEEFGRTVEQALLAKQEAHSVIAQFSFPPDVRTACEQYLLHFIDFLREVGVEANAELHESVAGVLFSVTPSDDREVLDKIRVALEIYLRLPGANIAGVPRDVAEQIALNQLQMNIHHFKAQLAAANARAMYLEAAVEAQRYTIGTLKLLAPSDVKLIGDDSKVAETPDDREEILDGLVAITRLKKEGFEVDLPEVYRRLRRFFAGR